MLFRLVQGFAAESGRRAILSAEDALTWDQLARAGRELADSLKALSRERVGVLMRPTPVAYAVLAALDALGSDAFLIDGRLTADRAREIAEPLHLRALVTSYDPENPTGVLVTDVCPGGAGSGMSTVTLLTSGTTGNPKAVRHSWETLCRPVRKVASGQQQHWLLTYRPHLYAGVQVALQCLTNGGKLVLAGDGDPEAVVSLMLAERVTHVSATPSYWRQILLFAPESLLRQLALRQITLGGEVVDQHILDALRRTFSGARIAHIYATTELGRGFSVTDGKAGFPRAYLDSQIDGGVELRIDDGELLIRSANAMQGYDDRSAKEGRVVVQDAWVRTGDLVDVAGDRVYFTGRKAELINVGGNKVSPLAVERVVRDVAGVIDSRAYGCRSSVAGQLVACDVVASPGQDLQELRQRIGTRTRQALGDYARPRIIHFVERVALTAAGKKERRAA